MDLHEHADRVCDQGSYLKFVRVLTADRAEAVAKGRAQSSSPYCPDVNGWENATI